MVYRPGEKSLSLWRVRAFLLALIPSFVCGAAWEFGSPAYLKATAVWLLALLGILYLYIPLRCRSCRCQVEENKIVARIGVLYFQERTIARESVQYASVVQAPLQRVFGLATVVLHAAGGRVLLRDLELEEALEISRQVLKQG